MSTPDPPTLRPPEVSLFERLTRWVRSIRASPPGHVELEPQSSPSSERAHLQRLLSNSLRELDAVVSASDELAARREIALQVSLLGVVVVRLSELLPTPAAVGAEPVSGVSATCRTLRLTSHGEATSDTLHWAALAALDQILECSRRLAGALDAGGLCVELDALIYDLLTSSRGLDIITPIAERSTRVMIALASFIPEDRSLAA